MIDKKLLDWLAFLLTLLHSGATMSDKQQALLRNLETLSEIGYQRHFAETH
jgi:hypothetical protein